MVEVGKEDEMYEGSEGDDEKGGETVRNSEEWWGMMRNGEKRWEIMRNGERWQETMIRNNEKQG